MNDTLPRTMPIKLARGESSVSSANLSSSGNVYLRIKLNSGETDDEIYTVLNSTTLLVRRGEKINKKFIFTRIFESNVSQAEFFHRSVQQQIADFLFGESSTILSYGASNSGKTYTMYGTPESPGIIPRSMELLFSSVNCTLAPWYKITDDNRVVALNEHDRVREIENKEDIMNPQVIGSDEHAQARLSLDNSSSQVPEAEDREFYNDQYLCSVWISIGEIYNENVYDLLIIDETERRPLKMAIQKDGTPCVYGLKFVHVTTALEACELLVFAQSKMTMSLSNENSTSSQSHTFFVAKLLKYQKETSPDEVRVSTLTFYDIAGSRSCKKGEKGSGRLSESRSINNSLVVFGRCLKSIRDGRSIGDHVAAPFRESKLTRMLQKVLTDKERSSFIITIDVTAVEAFSETLSVLNVFTAAKKLGSEGRQLKRISMITSRSLKSSAATSRVQSPERNLESDEKENLRQQNKMLLEKLEALKCENVKEKSVTKETQSEFSFVDYCALKEENEKLIKTLETIEYNRLNKELEIRQELADRYSAAMEELECSWKKRAQDIEDEGRNLLKWSVDQVETYYKERLDNIMYHKKRKRNNKEETDGVRGICEDLEAENALITSKVVILKEVIHNLKSENKLLSADRNKSNFELSLIKKKLKSFQDLARLSSPNISSKMTDNDIENLDYLASELKYTFDEKSRKCDALEKDLTRVKDENFHLSSKITELEKELLDTRISLQEASFQAKDYEAKLQEKMNSIEGLKLQLHIQRKGLANLPKLQTDYDDSIEYDPKQNVHNLDEKNNSACSDDFFGNDSVDNMDLITQAHVDLKVERFLDYDNSSPVKVSLNSVESTVIGRYAFRCSESGTIKEDSGIDSSCRSQRSTSGNESSMIQETRDECTQTNLLSLDNIEELNADCVKFQNYYERVNLDEDDLSQQVSGMNSVISTLQRMVDLNKSEVASCKSKLASCECKMEELERENEKLTKMIEMDSREYNKRIKELSQGLLLKEEAENRNSKRLKNSLERCAYLENQLSVLHLVHQHMEQSFAKCKAEHVSQIEKLENALSSKDSRTNELESKMEEDETDLLRVQQLHEKVSNLEILLEKYQEEKNNYRERLKEHFEMQSMLETKLQCLSEEIQRRDEELISLKKDVDSVMLTSNTNDESLKNLDLQIVNSTENMRCIKEEMTCFLETPENFGDSMRDVSISESCVNDSANSSLTEQIEHQNEEFGRLKLQLFQNEQEIVLIKKHRRHLIAKYECMLQQLRIETEKKREELIKLQKLLFSDLTKRCRRRLKKKREKKCVNSKKQSLIKHAVSCDECCTAGKPDFEESHSSMNGRGEILSYANSLTSESSIKNTDLDSNNISNTSNIQESSETESGSGLNDLHVDVRQVQSDASDCSEVPCGCGIGFKNPSRQSSMSGWMKVRRSNAKTDLLRKQSGEYRCA